MKVVDVELQSEMVEQLAVNLEEAHSYSKRILVVLLMEAPYQPL